MNIKMKLPMKFRILQLICEKSIQNKTSNLSEIFNSIKVEYGNEKQCCIKNIQTHILGLKTVGLINEVNVYRDNDKLVSEFKSTHEGFNRMKLIPNTAETYKEWLPFKRQANILLNNNN